ncbi:MAG TPA: hypothetical protein VFQ53_24400 [Kofleriaceae bacterium]|nr:hypothetical protein [Kofleriaceae bacterium]
MFKDLGQLALVPVGLAGIAHAVSATHGFAGVARCESLRATRPPEVVGPSEHDREVARALMAAALAAADRTDCDTVRRIEIDMRALDPTLHATFVEHPKLAPCLAGQ